MKKIISICIILALCFLTWGCANKNNEPVPNHNIEEKEPDKKDTDFDIKTCELDQVPYLFLEKVDSLSCYTKHTVGYTTSKMIIKYTQNIDSVFIKSETEKHLVTESTSTLVNVYHEAYFDSDNIRYREKDDASFTEATRVDYKKIFGVAVDEKRLEGFIISSDTVLEVKRIDSEEYNVFEIVIDGELAGDEVKVQMKKFGNLSKYPTFSKVSIKITVKDDFMPVKIDLVCDYKISVAILGTGNCHQEYEVTYSDISE